MTTDLRAYEEKFGKTEASQTSGHLTRILPPKSEFRKHLEDPSLISEEAKEIERELFGEMDQD